MQRYIRPMSFDDEDILYKWRCDDVTVKTSVTLSVPTIADHKEWMFERIFNPLQSVFMYVLNGKPVGTYTLIVRSMDSIEISYTVAPDSRNRSIGKEMVALAIKSIKGTWRVMARARKENAQSIRILEYVGMKRYDSNNEFVFYET